MPRGNKDTILQKNQETAGSAASKTNSSEATHVSSKTLLFPKIAGAGAKAPDKRQVGAGDGQVSLPAVQENNGQKKKKNKHLTVVSENGSIPSAGQTTRVPAAQSRPQAPVGAGAAAAMRSNEGSLKPLDTSWLSSAYELQKKAIRLMGVEPLSEDEMRRGMEERTQERSNEQAQVLERKRVAEQRKSRRKPHNLVDIRKAAGAGSEVAGAGSTTTVTNTDNPKAEVSVPEATADRTALRGVLGRRKLV